MTLAQDYAAKIARRARLNDRVTRSLEIRSFDYIVDDLIAADYGATPVGRFENVDKIPLRWDHPDWFEYIPDAAAPLRFIRSTGEPIAPGRMLTDGGSVPRWFWVKRDLSPWCHTPAFLIHDWEFDQHHRGAPKSFEAVRDTLAEALKTLMETGVTPTSEATFRMIYAGVSSWIAKDVWNAPA
jgi:hypothetical protein